MFQGLLQAQMNSKQKYCEIANKLYAPPQPHKKYHQFKVMVASFFLTIITLNFQKMTKYGDQDIFTGYKQSLCNFLSFPFTRHAQTEIMHFFNNGLDLAQLTPDKSSGHKQSFCEVGIPYFPISLKKCIEQTQIINFFFK